MKAFVLHIYSSPSSTVEVTFLKYITDGETAIEKRNAWQEIWD
jgi:hypothetical protein